MVISTEVLVNQWSNGHLILKVITLSCLNAVSDQMDITLVDHSSQETAQNPVSENAAALLAQEEGCVKSQPSLRAYGLEELHRHLKMLKVAVETGRKSPERKSGFKGGKRQSGPCEYQHDQYVPAFGR